MQDLHAKTRRLPVIQFRFIISCFERYRVYIAMYLETLMQIRSLILCLTPYVTKNHPK